MILIQCDQQAATDMLDRLAEHVPADTECGQPRIIHGGAVLITETDERFAVEVDTETGHHFVTRVRVTNPGISELTVWQDGTELARRTEPIADTGA